MASNRTCKQQTVSDLFFLQTLSSPTEWFEKFSMQIEKSLSLTDEIYLMGDINVDLKNGILTNTSWKHIVELHDLQQLIEEHTRVTAHSETLIDHLYVSTSDKVTDISVPSLAISDHYLICFTRSTTKIIYKRQVTNRYSIAVTKSLTKNDF